MDDQRTDQEDGGLIKPEWAVLVLAVCALWKLVNELIEHRYWDAASSAGCLGFVGYYFWNRYKKNSNPTR
jgi:hypothetical protein